jgi:phosphoribosylglycinamide formyltransferase-1
LKDKLRLAVLLSGGGTNLQALLNKALRGELAAEIAAVVSDRPDAYGLTRAREAGIPTHVVDYREILTTRLDRTFSTEIRELDLRQNILKIQPEEKRLERLSRLVSAEQKIIEVLDVYQPDYICLAGFMRLLTPFFLGHFNRHGEWRVINIHPALLPAFPGQHGYEDTVAYGCKWGGITVHFADEGEDTGPIIAQAVYPIFPRDDLAAVRARGLQLEYEVYAQCINWIASGDVAVQRSPEGRLSTVITDPGYSDILEAWIRQAFEHT